MPRIIDGDNLLGSWPGRSRSEPERRRLAGQVSRWAAARGRRAVLVFDGPSPAEGLPHHDAHFSGPGKSADAWILEFLRRQPAPREWVLVTNDKPLGDRARHLGARVERCDRFRQRMRRTAADKPEGPVDVDEWLDIFGVSEDPPADD